MGSVEVHQVRSCAETIQAMAAKLVSVLSEGMGMG